MNIHWQGSKYPSVFVDLKNSYMCNLSPNLYGGFILLVFFFFLDICNINKYFAFYVLSSLY